MGPHGLRVLVYFEFISSKDSEKVGIRRMGLCLYHHLSQLCRTGLWKYHARLVQRGPISSRTSMYFIF